MLLLVVSFELHFSSVNGILGGYNISIQEVPYHVNYGDICGGVLIGRSWVLTTAHCGNQSYIRIGNKHRLQGWEVNIQSHTIHPKYKLKHEFDYDVQLLKLRRPLHFSNSVKAVEISHGACGDKILVSGWGYLMEKGNYSDVLKQVRLKVISMSMCQMVQKSWYNHTLTPRMFCAGGGDEDACQGDSGGAAESYGYLVGISAFGYGCGRHIPGVYINVSDPSIRDWITYNTGI